MTRTIAHLSDLQWGRHVPAIAEALIADVQRLQPSVVVVSGDLTQRARMQQFVAARAFLDALPRPRLVVPGNHDIPLFDVLRRFVRPLERYRRFVTDDLAPVYRDDEIVVAGINTARSLVVKGGRVGIAQVAALREALAEVPTSVRKVVVTHHPLVAHDGGSEVAGRADLALQVMDRCGVDVVLAGHLHRGYAGDTRSRWPLRRGVVVVQCGTSISTRVRGEPNAYNVLVLDGDRIEVVTRTWDGERFTQMARATFALGPEGWQRHP